MGLRVKVQNILNKWQFSLDTFPRPDYQPLPWVGIFDSPRTKGSQERWKCVSQLVETYNVSSTVDIGSNMGFFSFSLAELGVPVLAVDFDERFMRVAKYVKSKNDFGKVGLLDMEINPDTVRLLPNADMVLCLSVWHHWVRYMGLDVASSLLREVWHKTDKVLLFETGENEMSDVFGLPDMTPSAKDWLDNYLANECPGGRVEHLGHMPAFDPSKRDDGENITRNLFAIHKN